MRVSPQIARGVIGAVVVGHYPLNQHPARLCIEDLEQYFFVKANLPAWTSPVHTLAFVLSTLSVAVVVSRVPVPCTQACCHCASNSLAGCHLPSSWALKGKPLLPMQDTPSHLRRRIPIKWIVNKL